MPRTNRRTLLTPHLAVRNGPSITKSKALKKYKLKAEDLNSLLPVMCQPNPHDFGKTLVHAFNDIDVGNLAARLKGETLVDVDASQPGAPMSTAPPELQLAEPNGRQIFRTKAMKKYKLTQQHMERLYPTTIEVNPHNPFGPPTRKYNEKEVKALANEVRGPAPSTSASTSPASSPTRHRALSSAHNLNTSTTQVHVITSPLVWNDHGGFYGEHDEPVVKDLGFMDISDD